MRDYCKGDDIMQWYKEVLDCMDDKKIYGHKELIDKLKMLKTDLSESSYHWAIRWFKNSFIKTVSKTVNCT